MAMLMAARPRPKPEMIETLRAPPPPVADASGMTPEQVARQRKIAAELAQSGASGAPVKHWLEGVNRIADGALGAFQDYTARQEEKKGRAQASDAWSKVMAETDPQKRTAAALALANNPWLGEAAQAATGAMVANEFRPPTDDQREFEAAKQGGFQGTFMDYMTQLRQAGAGMPTPTQKDYEYSKADPGFAEYQKDIKPPRPVPAGVQSAEDDDIGAVQTTQSINTQLDTILEQLKPDASGARALDLGPVNNLVAGAQNFAGMSTPSSRNLAAFQSTLEKIRNDSLRLNKGVQTEGDAIRAWNEVTKNINDPAVVETQLGRIKALNERAAAQRLQTIAIRRERNKMDPFDPAQIALPGAVPAAPPAPPPPGQFTPTDGGTLAPPAAPQGGPQPGTIEDGMQFIGGNPADPNSWKPAPQGGPEMAAPPGPMMAPPPAPDPYQLQDITRRREEMVKRHRMLTRP